MNRAALSMSAVRSYIGAKTRSAKEAQRESIKAGPFITISRQAGAGGTTVAELLARMLNEDCKARPEIPWTVFDRNLVEKVLEDHELPEEFRNLIKEEAPPELQRIENRFD